MGKLGMLHRQYAIAPINLLIAGVFGLTALAVVTAGLVLPLPGIEIVTDPREIFTTLGAGLTGPVGGVIIGILAGINEPGGIRWASILAHVAGGLWMGFSYRMLVHDRLQMPWRILGWAGLVLVYYYLVVAPGFVIGINLFYPETREPGVSAIGQYLTLARGVAPEALLTLLVTSLVLAALPRRRQRPLW